VGTIPDWIAGVLNQDAVFVIVTQCGSAISLPAPFTASTSFSVVSPGRVICDTTGPTIMSAAGYPFERLR
jgi:hypothetical protein